ncbi:MAG: P1 family peptidase [Firmicutes bacterium]|nr:P1 family peptidase [Bacillota bacterium]
MYGHLTDVPGVEVGQATDPIGLTGCTVILTKNGAVAGVDVRGAAPGTRETDLLRPMHLIEKTHAIVLTGGSAFGLDAASGVMQFLEEQGVGHDVGVTRVPIVPAAVLFDLGVGDHRARPDRMMGYQACLSAGQGPIVEGNVGAGTGATIGKLLGYAHCTKSGVGTFSLSLDNGLIVGALVAVNAFGDVVDPQTGQVVAGLRSPEDGRFISTVEWLKTRGFGQAISPGTNTTIGVVATNASLNKEQVNKVAQLAHNGLVKTIAPVHTMFDGDTIFALATGQVPGDVNVVGVLAVEVVAQAVLRAVKAATTVNGIKAWSDVSKI